MVTLSNWFQVGQIPSNAISGQYDPVLVGLSYVVAVLASYVALTLVGRLRAERNVNYSWNWSRLNLIYC